MIRRLNNFCGNLSASDADAATIKKKDKTKMLEQLENYDAEQREPKNFFYRWFADFVDRYRTKHVNESVADIRIGKDRLIRGKIERRKNGSIVVSPEGMKNGKTNVRFFNSDGVKNLSGRVSANHPQELNFSSLMVFSPNSKWRKYAMSEKFSLAEMSNIPLEDVAELLADVSPEVSNALHIRTILSNSGYEIEARNPTTNEIDEAANDELKKIRKILSRCYGTEDVCYSQAFMTLWLRGGFLAELVLKENLEDFADIAMPDPKTLKFRKLTDPVRGQIWDFGQMQQGTFVSFLEYEQIRYVPFMPFPNRREGRPIISSAFFIAIFIMAVLRDFKRVVQQQGYPRFDIEIDLEMMKELMPDDAENNPEEFEKWADGVVTKISESLEHLEPDEAFVHMKGIAVNKPVGAMGTNSLSAVDGMFNALERMAARACKVPPLFMGIIENVSEANANRQFESFLKDLQSGQHIIENSFAELFELALYAKGFLSKVHFRFAKARESERLRDGQADMMKSQIARYQYDAGWISQDEAAKRGADVDNADVPEPRSESTAVTIGTPNGDGGANRTRMPTLGDLTEAKAIFEHFAPEAATDLITASSATN